MVDIDHVGDLYSKLGISKDSKLSEIKDIIYGTKSGCLGFFRQGPDESLNQDLLNTAKKYLSSGRKRKKYDASLSGKFVNVLLSQLDQVESPGVKNGIEVSEKLFQLLGLPADILPQEVDKAWNYISKGIGKLDPDTQEKCANVYSGATVLSRIYRDSVLEKLTSRLNADGTLFEKLNVPENATEEYALQLYEKEIKPVIDALSNNKKKKKAVNKRFQAALDLLLGECSKEEIIYNGEKVKRAIVNGGWHILNSDTNTYTPQLVTISEPIAPSATEAPAPEASRPEPKITTATLDETVTAVPPKTPEPVAPSEPTRTKKGIEETILGSADYFSAPSEPAKPAEETKKAPEPTKPKEPVEEAEVILETKKPEPVEEAEEVVLIPNTPVANLEQLILAKIKDSDRNPVSVEYLRDCFQADPYSTIKSIIQASEAVCQELDAEIGEEFYQAEFDIQMLAEGTISTMEPTMLNASGFPNYIPSRTKITVEGEEIITREPDADLANCAVAVKTLYDGLPKGTDGKLRSGLELSLLAGIFEITTDEFKRHYGIEDNDDIKFYLINQQLIQTLGIKSEIFKDKSDFDGVDDFYTMVVKYNGDEFRVKSNPGDGKDMPNISTLR